MIISIDRARKLMNPKANKKYSDEQVEEVINVFTILSDIIIDSFVAKRKIEREVKIQHRKDKDEKTIK